MATATSPLAGALRCNLPPPPFCRLSSPLDGRLDDSAGLVEEVQAAVNGRLPGFTSQNLANSAWASAKLVEKAANQVNPHEDCKMAVTKSEYILTVDGLGLFLPNRRLLHNTLAFGGYLPPQFCRGHKISMASSCPCAPGRLHSRCRKRQPKAHMSSR